MIAVVTGGSGFLGQNLVRRLRDEGHDVRCLHRPRGGDGGGGGTPPKDVGQFPVRFDDPRSLLDCPAFEGADVVFHLAAATKALHADAFMAANVTPTRHLLGALAARRLHPRFVFVSSQAAAGPTPDPSRPLDEDDLPRPVEAYGRSKLEAERVVESFADRVAATIVRPCAVFGPRDRDFLRLFRLARRGLMLYPGVARHWFSVLYVDDVVAGLLAAARTTAAIGRTYFLAPTQAVQWRDFGEIIASTMGRRVRHVDIPAPLVATAAVAGELFGRLTRTAPIANRSKAALSRQKYWMCSASRARAELGFAEAHSLPEAVRRTYYWYRQSGWLRGSHGAASPPPAA